MKVWKTEKTRKVSEIETRIWAACQDVGFNKIAVAVEYTNGWVTGFFKQDLALTLEGFARLLHAAGLMVVDASGDEQVLVDSLSASSLRQAEAALNSRAPVGDVVTLTAEEFYQLKALAQYGSRHLFSMMHVIDHAAPPEQGAA
ncbi:MAG: hypothetical protein IPO08_23390 [Xanthomonadales bacterium]|nr:hypothetical protein [Xanthomonadales bacterium]